AIEQQFRQLRLRDLIQSCSATAFPKDLDESQTVRKRYRHSCIGTASWSFLSSDQNPVRACLKHSRHRYFCGEAIPAPLGPPHTAQSPSEWPVGSDRAALWTRTLTFPSEPSWCVSEKQSRR